MVLPDEIKEMFGGSVLINIGDHTCSCFVPGSLYLFEILEKYPVIHRAVIEATLSAKSGFYSVGILTYSQLIYEFPGGEEPEERHRVAHEILKETPSEKQYREVKKEFHEIATKRMIDEFYRHKNRGDNYKEAFDGAWQSFIS